jgi:hypothetical protein
MRVWLHAGSCPSARGRNPNNHESHGNGASGGASRPVPLPARPVSPRISFRLIHRLDQPTASPRRLPNSSPPPPQARFPGDSRPGRSSVGTRGSERGVPGAPDISPTLGASPRGRSAGWNRVEIRAHLPTKAAEDENLDTAEWISLGILWGPFGLTRPLLDGSAPQWNLDGNALRTDLSAYDLSHLATFQCVGLKALRAWRSGPGLHFPDLGAAGWLEWPRRGGQGAKRRALSHATRRRRRRH